MVMNAGIASVRSVRFMSVIELNIIIPTITITGAVAAAGMARKTGLRNSARVKQTAIVNEVRPVRPPWATPEELSTNAVTAQVPKRLAAAVPTESARNIPLRRGILPFSSTNPPLRHSPSAEPVSENRSINRKDSRTTRNCTEKTCDHWNWANIGVID